MSDFEKIAGSKKLAPLFKGACKAIGQKNTKATRLSIVKKYKTVPEIAKYLSLRIKDARDKAFHEKLVNRFAKGCLTDEQKFNTVIELLESMDLLTLDMHLRLIKTSVTYVKT